MYNRGDIAVDGDSYISGNKSSVRCGGISQTKIGNITFNGMETFARATEPATYVMTKKFRVLSRGPSIQDGGGSATSRRMRRGFYSYKLHVRSDLLNTKTNHR